MTDKALLGDSVGIHFPVESVDGLASRSDELPPPYQHPTIDYSSGWKDRFFAIIFWIHMAAVIIIGLVLGVPMILPYVKHNIFDRQEQKSFDSNIRIYACALSGAAAVSGFTSFIIFILLKLCAGRIIICSLIISVIIELLLGVFLLLMVSGMACIVPFIFLVITLIYILCIRKRIPFAEAHLRTGCAALHSHPSLIFTALGMLVVEFLWLLFWCLMALGILQVTLGLVLNVNTNTTATTNMSDTKEFIETSTYKINSKSISSNKKLHRFDSTDYDIDSTPYPTNKKLYQYNRENDSSDFISIIYHRIVRSVITFILLLSWYWGMNTFANVVHFITACTVGQWWFTDDTSEQYAIGTSIKRAFTTNFGTICLGSLLEAIIKALRSSENKTRRGFLDLCASCILRMFEKVIGYINEWAFIYAALTGQSFVEASRSFIELFGKRGWTMIINDHLVNNCLMIINIVVGLISALVAGLIVYVFASDPLAQIKYTIIYIAIISFIIGAFLSTVMTTILSSCSRTIFVCFALNPAALGATHPDHLQSLTNVWHQLYPTEFANSGYDNHVPKPFSENIV